MAASDPRTGRGFGIAACVALCATLLFELFVAGGQAWWLFAPVLIAQAYGLVRLGLFVFVAGSPLAERGPRLSETRAAELVALTEVAVIAAGESMPSVRTAVVAAIDATSADRVLLVGADPRLDDLASRLGVRWFRSKGSFDDGMAVAVANASQTFLALTTASTAVVPRALHGLARYFDRGCAWVQTSPVAPEHRRPREHLEQLRVGPIVDGWRAAPFTGAGAIVQVRAIQAAGLAQGALGATVALQARGWYGRSVRGTLAIAQGDLPTVAIKRDAVSAVASRTRTAFSRRSPLTMRGLPWRSRLVHLRTILDDLAGAVYALMTSAVIAMIVVGRFPFTVGLVLIGLTVTGHALATAARSMLSGGLLRPGTQGQSDADEIAVSLAGVARAVVPQRRVHGDTDDAVVRDRREVLRTRRATLVLVVALELALAARSLSAMFGWGVPERLKSTDLALLAVGCLLYTSPSPRDGLLSRMPSSA